MKVKVLKEGKNFGGKIADLILAGKDSHRQAAEFIKMGIVPMEDIVLAVKEKVIPIYNEVEALGDKRSDLYSDLAGAERMDDYTWSDKLSWDINAVTKQWRQANIPLNNLYDFWKESDIDADNDYMDEVDKLLQDEDLRKMIPGFRHAWRGNHDYDEDYYGVVEHKQGNDMKQLLEVFKRNVLTEAAKNAEDLKNFNAKSTGEEWARGLWRKYGIWKLSDIFNFGITQHAKDNWYKFGKKIQDKLTNKWWQQLLKSQPIPCVVIYDRGGKLEVSYGAVLPKTAEPAHIMKFDSGDRSQDLGGLMAKGGAITGFPGGSITLHKAGKMDGGECNGAFVVDSTYATTKGWGPLLYDIAMEVSTVLGNGLTSSRGMVSSKAKPVWDYYLDKRSDVEADQLDVDGLNALKYGLDQLTPKLKVDDCEQTSAIKWAHGEDYGAWDKDDIKSTFAKMRKMSDEEKANVPWTKQAISKAYRKDPDILKMLGDSGLLHFPALGYDLTKYHTKPLPPFPKDLPPPEEPEEEPPPEDEERPKNWGGGRTSFSEGKIRIKIK